MLLLERPARLRHLPTNINIDRSLSSPRAAISSQGTDGHAGHNLSRPQAESAGVCNHGKSRLPPCMVDDSGPGNDALRDKRQM